MLGQAKTNLKEGHIMLHTSLTTLNYRWAWWLSLTLILLTACSQGDSHTTVVASTATTEQVTATTASLASTATSVASPTATPALTGKSCLPQIISHEAWNIEQGSQIYSYVNGAESPITRIPSPIGLPNEAESMVTLVKFSWSPDYAHLAAVYMEAPKGRSGSPTYIPVVIQPASNIVQIIPNAHTSFVQHNLTWADAHTLLIFGGPNVNDPTGASFMEAPLYRYDLNTHAVSTLNGIAGQQEGLVRGTTLFTLSISPLTTIGDSNVPPIYKGSAYLHRFNLETQHEIGTPLAIGDYGGFETTDGGASLTLPGWDVSSDGQRIGWEQMTVSAPTGLAQSKFIAAQADGSGRVAILTNAIAAGNSVISIAPNHQSVAVVNAGSTPNTLVGNMQGGVAKAFTPDLVATSRGCLIVVASMRSVSMAPTRSSRVIYWRRRLARNNAYRARVRLQQMLFLSWHHQAEHTSHDTKLPVVC